MKNTFLLAFILTTTMACSSSTTKPGDKSADTSNLVCEKTATTGTHMKRKRCVSREQAERERLAAQDYMRKNTKSGTASLD